ncbi:platelet glycoprotein V-like [Chironomus tepperi]|uniref:platelet glycoprotein V-like n=1 Tax=Chironomus tepperi TaxID=113505 RepID=UPI00391F7271
MLNLKLFTLFLLISVLNLDIASSYKCNFLEKTQSSDRIYTCVAAQDSPGKEHHLAHKTDNDVLRVDYELTSTDNSPIMTDTDYPFCTKYPKLQKILLKKVKSVDKNFLQHCSNLHSFTISRSETKLIPALLFSKNTKLATLDLSKNAITTVNENAFVNNKELIYLSLDENKLSTIQPNTFKALTKVAHLGLRGNKIKILNPAWFDTLTNLKYLDLGANGIADLPKNIFSRLGNLQKLYVDNNKLTTVHSDSFGTANKLAEIHLDYNKISSIDEKIVDNTPVQRFVFDGGVCIKQKKSIKRDTMKAELKDCFAAYRARANKAKKMLNYFRLFIFLLGLINSQVVYAFKCDFQVTNDLFRNYYTCLISQESNNINEVHLPQSFDGDVSRISIQINFYDITESEYPFCQRFPKLKKVYMTGSGLALIDGNLFQRCNDLMEVTIEAASIQDIPENLFSNNIGLTTVSITKSKLKTLPEKIFENNKNLYSIILDENEIVSLPPKIFKSLTSLDKLSLSNNKIKQLNPSWFEDLKRLDILNLDHNEISELPKNVFKNLKKLDLLQISSNKITTIHSDSFGYIRELTLADFENNTINAVDGKIFDVLQSTLLNLRGNTCCQSLVWRGDDEIKDCYQNYQPREE